MGIAPALGAIQRHSASHDFKHFSVDEVDKAVIQQMRLQLTRSVGDWVIANRPDWKEMALNQGLAEHVAQWCAKGWIGQLFWGGWAKMTGSTVRLWQRYREIG
jgi:hypothetical protein